MNWVDIAILVIIALSAGISLLRGFVREALSLLAWIISIWVAITFSHKLSVLLENMIASASARLAVAFVALFVITLIAGSMANYLASQLVKKTGLTGTDRMLGVIFGVARGIAVVVILVMLAGLTQSIPEETWWKQSMLMTHFQDAAIWMRGFLPHDVAKNIAF
ncbi:MAG: CvpA family protein [Gammaproteobacteria bacterium]|nr:CvpA family protein [Gammaproteobacteria bacterium]MCK5092582.1 CvpA family protein [Gammaproteobacteria bacterium]